MLWRQPMPCPLPAVQVSVTIKPADSVRCAYPYCYALYHSSHNNNKSTIVGLVPSLRNMASTANLGAASISTCHACLLVPMSLMR